MLGCGQKSASPGQPQKRRQQPVDAYHGDLIEMAEDRPDLVHSHGHRLVQHDLPRQTSSVGQGAA